MGKNHSIGIIGHSCEIKAACRKALGLLFQVVFYEDVAEACSKLNHSFLIFCMQNPKPEDTQTLKKCLEFNSELSVLVLAANLTANQAVELIQFGAVDFLELPTESTEIRLKVERHLLGRRGPIFVDELFIPFEPSGGRLPQPYMGSNRRICYRASVPLNSGARVQVSGEGQSSFFEILELSVVTDARPGGLLLRPALRAPSSETSDGVGTDIDVGAQSSMTKFAGKEPEVMSVPWQILKVGHQCEVLITVPDLLKRVVPVKAQIVCVNRDKQKLIRSRIALQYMPGNADDARLLEEFWMLCQRSENVLP